MKTFDDLVFEPHPTAVALKRSFPVRSEKDPHMKEMCRATRACMEFGNGYGVSVICGIQFYSNGSDTYEVCDLFDGDARFGTVRGWLSRKEVTEVMMDIQQRT